MIDIPRIFTISESEHRIHNPLPRKSTPRWDGRCEWRRAPPFLTSAAAPARCSVAGRAIIRSSAPA